MSINDFLQTLVGPKGRYFRWLWEPNDVLKHMLRSAKITIKCRRAVEIINGQCPLHAKYMRTYLDNGGLSRLVDDLCAFVAYYPSTAMLLDIHTRIHMAVAASNWSSRQITALDHYYVADKPTRDQIAIYFAHVMHTIICS